MPEHGQTYPLGLMSSKLKQLVPLKGAWARNQETGAGGGGWRVVLCDPGPVTRK